MNHLYVAILWTTLVATQHAVANGFDIILFSISLAYIQRCNEMINHKKSKFSPLNLIMRQQSLVFDLPVSRAVTRSSLKRGVIGSNLGPVKSDIVVPTARHHCSIFLKGAVLPLSQ